MFDQLSKINLRYLYATRRYLIMMVGVIGLTLIIAGWIVLPRAQAAWQDYQTYQKEQKTLEQLERKAAELENVSTSATFAKVNQVNEVLPSKKPLLELMTTLNQVAGQTQVVFTKVELAPGTIASDSTGPVASTQPTSRAAAERQARSGPRRDYETLDVELNVEGNLAQINAFLEAVEKIAPATTITNMSLNKQARLSATRTEEMFEAQLQISSYYFTKSISATLEAPLPPIGANEESVLAELDSFTYAQLVPQQVIQGGGLDDLFRVEELESALQEQI